MRQPIAADGALPFPRSFALLMGVLDVQFNLARPGWFAFTGNRAAIHTHLRG